LIIKNKLYKTCKNPNLKYEIASKGNENFKLGFFVLFQMDETTGC